MRKLASVAFAFLLTACATTQPHAPSLAAAIDAAIDTPPFHHAFWSILVEEDSGRVLYSRNADKLTIPASNRKLFAAATISECLGNDTRLETELWRDGDDLVLRGGGDPSLGSWRYERDGDFDALAAQLRSQGVTRVRDVVADVSAFDRVTIPGSWKYGNLGNDYAASVDALSWGESEIPEDRAVADPPLHAAEALRDALQARGIDVAGVRVNTEPHAWGEKLATLPSPFVGHLLTTVMKNSHNLYAEMLFKRIAGGTYDGAFALERTFLTSEVHVDGEQFRFEDGSGLSPDDVVTPHAILTMLRWMNEPVRRGFWWSVLAQPAGEGTLRRRVVTLEQRMRGKTGTLNGVNALSGIVAMPDGRYRYFSAIVNHHISDGDDAQKILDSIALRVAGEN